MKQKKIFLKREESNMIDKKLGESLRSLRHLRGYSQNQISDEIGVTFQQFQKYEKGTNRLYVSRLVLICNRLGISIESFFRHCKVQHSNNSLRDPANVVEFDSFSNKDVVRLAKSFSKIENSKVKKHILSLVENLAELSQDMKENISLNPDEKDINLDEDDKEINLSEEDILNEDIEN
ncbi:MAG: DNA-binding domain protein [Candidatus Xenolissoclinum pacificiensis L6]|uniref:DNA-binding domain protein n=1 Tax=Candidatus Xenolissoclinum pacificiensis L6 TaxID=1401685 RepID=W2V2Z6_9RICK|nr:MAG: DNA-binding domain protein [Candidatus Xenolissoclinum pacificiensis L6]